MDNRISQAIQDVINEGTFTPGALEQFKIALNKAVEVENELAATRGELDAMMNRTAKAETLIDKMREEAQLRFTREADLEKREAACHEAEIKNAADNARAETFDKCFNKVFGNVEIHRAVTGSKPVVQGGGNGCSSYASREGYDESETVTEDVS